MTKLKLFCEHCGAPLMNSTSDLRARRLQLGMKQKVLAGKIGLSWQYVNAFENGRRQPSRDILERWARVLA